MSEPITITTNKKQYIYLIKEREFIACNENVYRIGISTSKNLSIIGYKYRSSETIFKSECINYREIISKIVALFNNKYIRRRDFGTRYYQGDSLEMKEDIINILRLSSSV
jgi:hypothetical protein